MVAEEGLGAGSSKGKEEKGGEEKAQSQLPNKNTLL